MHGNTNLLRLGGNTPTRYACKVAEKLFGKELRSKRIVLSDSPDRSNQSEREAIVDDPRIDTLERKFNLIDIVYVEFVVNKCLFLRLHSNTLSSKRF